MNISTHAAFPDISLLQQSQSQSFFQQPQPQQLDHQHQHTLLQRYVARQQRWILFMRHCCQCRDAEQNCPYERNCSLGKQLWQHILSCRNPNCTYHRCQQSRLLLKHHQKCQSVICPICIPVKDYLQQVRSQLQSTKCLLDPTAIDLDIQDNTPALYVQQFEALLR